jgi:uncharacterized membrane protein
MRPSTPHYTSPADLRERLNQIERPNQPYRIQTGVVEHGGAIRGFMFAVAFEGVAALIAVALWYIL